MGLQYSVAVRNAQNDQFETTTGAASKLQLRSGAAPANCAAADSGTLLAELTLPSDWLTPSSAGVKQKNGTWSGTGSAAGTVGHFRIKDNAGTTTHVQGTVTQPVVLATNAVTAANGNVLNFAATTGVVVGMNVSGVGVVAGSTVVATTGTTVTLSHTSTAGVANGASITFGGDMTIDNVVIAVGQAVRVDTFDLTRGNA
jgi:hypothetical protein